MVTNTAGGLFPIINNEISVNYGINNWFSIGVFHDLYYNSYKFTKGKINANEQLIGLRGTLSVLPLLGENLNDKLSRWNFSFSGYISYDRGGYYMSHTDKKDLQQWVNYYKIGGRYFLSKYFYITASAGILNTNRFYIGLGLKL